MIQVSPGVAVSEIDQTTTVPAISTSDGGFAGDFNWGPANTRVLIDSENTLVARFGKPDNNNFVSFFTAANFLAYGNNLKVVRAVGTTAKNATGDGSGLIIENTTTWQNNYSNGEASVGDYAARYPGSLGNSIKVSICPSSNAFNQTIGALGANTTSGSPVITFNANVSSVLTAGDLIKIGSNGYSYVSSVAANGLLATVNSSTQIITATLASVTRKWAYADSFQSAPGTSPYAASVAGANDEMHIAVVDTTGAFTPQGANTILEVYPFVSKASDAKNSDGTTNFYRDVIYNNSRYTYWMDHPTVGVNWGSLAAGVTFTDTALNRYTQLSGGVTSTPQDAQLALAYDKLASADDVDVSLLLAGGASTVIQNYITSIAENRRDCVGFVSPRLTDVVNQPGNELTNCTSWRNSLSSSSYMFADSGWKYMLDKYNGVNRWVPLNGDMAGLCVRTDTLRDPWFSPAGLNRGQVKNVIKLAWNPSQANRDELYKIGINPVVSFPGQGPVLYGDKTLQSKPSAFDRINVRRLFIILEKTIATSAKYSLFEFNDEFTRAQFVNLVEPFLRDVQGRRGIYDYRVVCDLTNNTAEVIDTNRFVGDIWIKPARSVNYIQLNFIAVGTGVSFTTKAGGF